MSASRKDQPQPKVDRSWEERSGHTTELEPHAGGLWIYYCRTCKARSPEFQHNEHDADVEALRHHYNVANGANQVASRGIGMGPSIRHARDMALRETTPEAERPQWTKLADDMERQLRTSSRVKPHEILEGQQDLFSSTDTTEEGAPS